MPGPIVASWRGAGRPGRGDVTRTFARNLTVVATGRGQQGGCAGLSTAAPAAGPERGTAPPAPGGADGAGWATSRWRAPVRARSGKRCPGAVGSERYPVTHVTSTPFAERLSVL
ncbi:hypothetical protein ACFPM0_06865 [Pseudonocardia sulfidoxydans]|uniref:hypothetical protein n=1 Tax=Pseudonocardia sulfidoxydans TaxID=54011 RepID=UPI0036199664